MCSFRLDVILRIGYVSFQNCKISQRIRQRTEVRMCQHSILFNSIDGLKSGQGLNNFILITALVIVY